MSSIGGSANTTKASIIGAPNISSGTDLPQLPSWDPKWDLAQYHVEQERYEKALLEYIRRLNNKVSTAIHQAVTAGIAGIVFPDSTDLVGAYVGDGLLHTGSYSADLVINGLEVGDYVHINALVLAKRVTGGPTLHFYLDTFEMMSGVGATQTNGQYCFFNLNLQMFAIDSNNFIWRCEGHATASAGTTLPVNLGDVAQSTPASGSTITVATGITNTPVGTTNVITLTNPITTAQIDIKSMIARKRNLL